MTVDEVMARLESLSDEKVRSINYRNGAGDKQFGVKLGDLRVIAKEIKVDPQLAAALWETENLDAMLLSTLITRPKEIPAERLEEMVASVTTQQLADWLGSYVVKLHPQKEVLRQKWMQAKDPMSARAGWSLTAARIAKESDGLDLVELLDRIEKEMGGADPLVQWTMNSCLAEIGINFPEHRTRALAIGETLGVYRDYPCAKGCTSPFAPIWINEMVSRQGK